MNRSLSLAFWRLLLLGSLGYLGVAVLITVFFPRPSLTLLIDRGYCPSQQWQALGDRYDELYRQQRWGQIRLQQIVLFSSLGEEVQNQALSPQQFRDLRTYGRSAGDRARDLQRRYPQSVLLRCAPP
jgi:hypothetical protein